MPRNPCQDAWNQYATDLQFMAYYKDQWQATGDIAFRDSYYYWQGKADDDSAMLAC